MTVMGDAAMDGLSDRGSTPLTSTIGVSFGVLRFFIANL